MLEGLFNNEAIKKTLLKKFVKGMKEKGITQILIDVSGGEDEIGFEPLEPDSEKIMVEKKDYNFYKEFFQKHKNLLNG